MDQRVRYVPPHERARLARDAAETAKTQNSPKSDPPKPANKPEEKSYCVDGLFPANQHFENRYFPQYTGSSTFNWTPDPSPSVEAEGKDVPPPARSFEDIDLGPVVTNNLKLGFYKGMTPIQQHVIPVVMAGRDIIACSETGMLA